MCKIDFSIEKIPLTLEKTMKIQLRQISAVLFVLAFAFMGCSNGSGGASAGESVVTIAEISGVTAPVVGATRVTAITETTQYTGTVTWDGVSTGSKTFAGSKVNTAIVTLASKSGYTLTGVAANFFTVAGATSATNPADSGVITVVFPATATVSIGGAIGGGKVAYILQSGDSGYVAGEQHGLIAAPADQSTGIIWAIGTYQSTAVPGGTGTALGTGSSNTDKIVAQNGAGIAYAAGLAHAYNGAGYTDWYLPSKDELYKLYLNKDSIGGFASGGHYWTSSEVDANNAWDPHFPGIPGGTGTQITQIAYSKSAALYVRAIRAF